MTDKLEAAEQCISDLEKRREAAKKEILGLNMKVDKLKGMVSKSN